MGRVVSLTGDTMKCMAPHLNNQSVKTVEDRDHRLLEVMTTNQ
jgi:hypothetical protein